MSATKKKAKKQDVCTELRQVMEEGSVGKLGATIKKYIGYGGKPYSQVGQVLAEAEAARDRLLGRKVATKGEKRESKAKRKYEKRSVELAEVLGSCVTPSAHCVHWADHSGVAEFPDLHLRLTTDAMQAMHSAATGASESRPLGNDFRWRLGLFGKSTTQLEVSKSPGATSRNGVLQMDWGADARNMLNGELEAMKRVNVSEALAIEILSRVFNERSRFCLLASETALDDEADFLCSVDDSQLGVDVTRAFAWDIPTRKFVSAPSEMIEQLLQKKLEKAKAVGVHRRWKACIWVWVFTKEAAEKAKEVYERSPHSAGVLQVIALADEELIPLLRK